MTFRYPAMMLLSLLLVGNIGLTSVDAQEREARRQFLGALAKLEEGAKGSARWKAWRDRGGLLKLTREIDAGKQANPGEVRDNLASLAESLGQTRADVTHAQEAMNNWLSQLELSFSDEQTTVVEAAIADSESGVASRDAFHKDLRGQIERLERSLKGATDGGASWRDFLQWESTSRLLAQEPLASEVLGALETRWTLAQSHWQTFGFRFTAQSVLRAIVLARRESTEDLPAKLKDALQHLPAPTEEVRAEELTALKMLDQLDLGAIVSVPWHRRHASPHCQLSIRARALLPSFTEKIDETFRISDRFAGTPVRGNGRIQGQITIEPLERVVPAWNVIFKGNTTSATVGANSGVTINSSATATIRGEKTIEWRDKGLVPLPANATANATISFGGISTGGSRGRRNTARSEVYASRATAERDTELAIERSCIERLNAHTLRLLQPINERYNKLFTLPVNGQDVFAPRVITRTEHERAQWNCWYAKPEGLAVAELPELTADDQDWSLILHKDFLARHLTSMLAEREVTMDELGSLLGAPKRDAATEASASPTFRLRTIEPIEVRFEEQKVELELHLDEFRSSKGNVTVPTTIAVSYDCALASGEIQLTRTASPSVRIATGEGATGRSQTLKRMLIRHLARALPEQATLELTALAQQAPSSSIKAQAATVTIDKGWLQLSGTFVKP